jgi:hypothetical protein
MDQDRDASIGTFGIAIGQILVEILSICAKAEVKLANRTELCIVVIPIQINQARKCHSNDPQVF